MSGKTLKQMYRDEIDQVAALNDDLLEALRRISTLSAYMNSSGNGSEGTLAKIGYIAESAISKAKGIR